MSATDTIYCNFWAIFCPFTLITSLKIKIWKTIKLPGEIILLQMCTINEDYTMYASWEEKHDKQCFLLSDLPNNPKNQNLKKMEKMLGDIIVLQLCITNDDHITYDYRDIEHDRNNFPLIRDFFCHFTPLLESRILKYQYQVTLLPIFLVFFNSLFFLLK